MSDINNAVTELDLIRKQLEQLNRSILAKNAFELGLISSEEYKGWLNISPFIRSLKKGNTK